LLLRKPIISLLITVALLVFMTAGAAELRPTAESAASVWLIAVVLLLIVDGVVWVLIILPRSLKTEGEAKSLIQWAGAIAIYLVAWVSWFLFGVPSWILVVGAAATVVVLLTVLRSLPPATSE
jgi:hypothetical protein